MARRVKVSEYRSLIESPDYRCALTGRELTPQTADADHMMPASRGGEHEIENIQILHMDVNRAKGTMTTEEFVQMCVEIAVHAGGCEVKTMPDMSRMA